ncbi:hypothetical protein LSTR_LSTR011736 [Laodelphax striatellus]|uniref:5' exonuclease Apollo n=1 Tax=Laodelphax striatellus TaxID=195883 RepID=A0A482WLW4_LAOST|nr:hypothetical protein LSTR_LSTR011736 [Laodelphax striatellus]
MYGFKVPKSNICVDYWDDEKEPQVRFLTHAQDNRLHNIANVKDRIYMSPFSLWYLKYVRKENFKGDVNCLMLNKRHKIEVWNEFGNKEKFFYVILIDANHCAGSVMYYFEGDFGQVLCTGDFRYTPTMLDNPTLKSLIKSKSLDILNVDNRYIAEHCKFPPNEEVVSKTVELLKSFPEHKIIICIGKWGKLDLLMAIAKEFEEKIKVDQTCMMVANRLRISNIFTLQEARITTHDSDLLSLKDLHALKSKIGPTILLIMNAFYYTSVDYSEQTISEFRDLGLNIMPYSEHSDHRELYEFIDALRPNFIVPVVRPSLGSCLIPAVARNSAIPETITVLQRSYRTGLSQGEAMDENSSQPALFDLLENSGFKGFDTNEGEEPASKRTKMMSVLEEKHFSTAENNKVNTCEVEEGHVNNDEMNDSEYLKMLNYWSDQGVTGNTFRHPDLKGVYDYK